MSGFAKVFESILVSSVWTEPDHVLRLWITLMVRCDSKGFVEGSIPGLTRVANIRDPQGQISVELGRDAFARLQAPDPDSKTKTDEGRRIREVERGWVVINHKFYRDLMSIPNDGLSMTPEAIRQRRHRAKDGVTSVTDVTSGDNDVTAYASAADSGSGSGKEGVQGESLPPEPSPVMDYCVRLAVAANLGLGCDMPRIIATSGSTRMVADFLIAADIPIEFSEKIVLERARSSHSKSEVRSLSYFRQAVVEAWEKAGIAAEMKRSKLGEPTKIATLIAKCPYCEEPVAAPLWSTHFATKHHDKDVPLFRDSRA